MGNNDEILYHERFNSGYKIARYEPGLSEMIKPSLSSTDFSQGAMLDGIGYGEMEREQERLSELDNRQTDMEPDQDLEH